MSINESSLQQPERKNGGCLKTIGIMLITIIISIVATIFVINYLTQKKLEPVELSKKEESTLNQKLKQFGLPTLPSDTTQDSADDLTPEPYSEDPSKREIFFTEKELNAMLAKNTDLAEKIAIDLADNLASAKMLIPLDPDFPFLGGKTLKLRAGAELAYANGRPIVILKGVSVWGVPVPNAWLGNLKNVDLVKEFGGDEGFWKSFADGVENISVAEGQLKIKLKE
ncbi:arginine N-succinyltransferase [Cocleimonas sp. KMM 6892]|uniref:arginine N-succinyltransferase n=1 Tax=unclassified Cocleimonas TaxID=2639732 RepID=UPI002DBA7C44|nr:MULTISPECIES: arginine N-succinyltransferase [unclassified Cocleimonas]MEB8432486.1 arginine N-succinyltransferase [Cocleimonas sp. KMM 6892]MEC4715345.1 arginine N-succinyltransferase [Cocleimonas sp. KMM 6895]MEC4745036.1 arginine N-succinyltransferase [Cocleimonas sp. KMM 6896]